MSAPPRKVPTEAIERAVSALLKWNSTQTQLQKPQLLPSDNFLYLILTLHKIPDKSRVNAHKIPLPHPLHTRHNSSLCLLLPDHLSQPTKQLIDQTHLPVSKVIKLDKLRKNYKSFEQKRKLCDSYDLFLTDKSIVPLLPNVLGKVFYKKKRVPVPVEVGRGSLGDQVERVCRSGLLYLSSGSCAVVKVARASMSREEIVDNVVAAVEGVAGVVPSKWKNVRSFHLKFAESVALPVYQKVPDVGMKFASVGFEEKKKESVVVKESGEAKMKKRGRIHEVSFVDEMVGEGESGSEGEGQVVEVVERKRKKGGQEKVVSKKAKNLDGKAKNVDGKVKSSDGKAKNVDGKARSVDGKVKKGEKELKMKVKKGVAEKKAKRSKVSV